MRGRPERVAWLILLISFALFCTMAVTVPLGIRSYILYDETPHEVSVESLVGTVVVEPPVGLESVPLSKGQAMLVPEGTVVRVDESSQAAITFFDHSFMRLYSGTIVRLVRQSSPRYAVSPLSNTIHLELIGGRVHIGTALSEDRFLDFRVAMPYAVVEASVNADGSYAVETDTALSEVIVYRGHASVQSKGEEVELDARQRTTVAIGQPLQPAVSVARNLVANGDFLDPLDVSWRVFNDQGTDGGELDGQADLVVDGGRRAVKLSRSDAQGNHCETVLEQMIDGELSDPITSLLVRATVKVRYQGLSGGGYLSSEYPLMIRLTYRDVYDSEAEWVQGFYYQNVAANPTTYGLQISRDQWFLFESENLLESLPVRPFKIVKIRVYASGWDYESLVSDLNLIVE